VTLGDQAGRVNINTATLTINVIRNQNTPFFISLPYQRTIDEATAQQTSIYQVTARDNDAVNTFERVTYQVTGDGNAPAFFSVDSQSGVIRVIQSLAGNVDTVYNLRITAFDNGTPPRSNSTIVYITIDRNRNAPFFNPTSYSASVADNGILGSQVAVLSVFDRDTVAPYNTTRCILRQSTGSQYFFINEDTCVLYLARNIALDLNAPSTYTITVGAYDLGTPQRVASQDATVFISVQRNQFDPVFINQPYDRTIQQDVGLGTFVVRVTATDRDTVPPFGEVSYRLIGDDTTTQYFTFDPVSRNITVTRDLTLDTVTAYQVRIEARDGGNPSRSATSLFQISVQRNLFSPTFLQSFYNETIDETQSLGTTIVQIRAEDRDTREPHRTITYTMSDFNQNSLASQFFIVNSATGAITLRQSLLNDNLDTRRYTFSVSITDNGVPQRAAANVATVEINVRRNTNPPFFVSTPYDTRINYTANSGILVFTATAQDLDAPPYNVITYDLLGDGDATVFFRIDPATGAVRLQQSVESETTTQYRVSAGPIFIKKLKLFFFSQ